MIDITNNPDASLDELEAAHKALLRQIEEKQIENRKCAFDAIQKLIAENKLDPREVADMLNAKGRRKKARALYRNPANARQTWSGIGKPPLWYVDAPDKEALKIEHE